MIEQKTPPQENEQISAKPKGYGWLRVMRRMLVALFILAVLAVGVLWGAVAFLTSDRITPIVNTYASRYLNADIEARRVELSFWKSFPLLNLEIDSITVVSRAFNSLDSTRRAALPADADSLLTLRSFSGGINLVALASGKIDIHDVELADMAVNLVIADSASANFNIVPASSDSASSSSALPEIAINRFVLSGVSPVTFRSLPDSTDVRLTIDETSLHSAEQPLYSLRFDASGNGRFANTLNLDSLSFAANGGISWSPEQPGCVGLEDFDISAGGIGARINADLDLSDLPIVNRLDIEGDNLRISDLLNLASRLEGTKLPAISTDMKFGFKARLLKPFNAADTLLPSVEAELKVEEGSLTYERLHLRRLALDAKATLPDGDINKAVVELNRLMAIGSGVGFELKATARAAGNIKDPSIKGHFKGGIGSANLPRQLLDRLPFSVSGKLIGSTDFSFKPSMFSPKGFHRLVVRGDLRLSDFMLAMRDSSMEMNVSRASLDFNSRSRFVSGERMSDSLLAVGFSIDTASFASGGVRFKGVGLSASAGCRNMGGRAISDSTLIVPMGARVTGHRLSLNSDSDSSAIHMRDLNIGLIVTRYADNMRQPLVQVTAGSKTMLYSDRLNRMMLRGAEISMKLHPRSRPRLSRRATAVFDSLNSVYPNLSVDSLYNMTQRIMAARRKASGQPRVRRDSASIAQSRSAREADIDFGVDRSIKSWLRLWNASGSIRASRGRAFTPYFPLRNRLDSLDISFNTDTVAIRHARYSSGHSSVKIDGYIGNITSALTSRRGNPIDLRLNLSADTLDINAFAEAAFAGSAFAARTDSTTTIAAVAVDSDDEEAIQKSVEDAATEGKAAFVVPSNIRGNLSLTARTALYSDIVMKRLVGSIEIGGGAIHLSRLSAATDMGSINLSALYTAPSLRNIDFAGGMLIRNLDLKKFLRMIPEVDSLLPLLNHIEGSITADLALTTELDSMMDMRFNTLKAAMKLEGDSLVLLDNETFSTLSKWLMFKSKNRNLIDHMSVEMVVDSSYLQTLPFVFDFDRYRLGVWGGNDLDMNFDYHVAVLKSPMPFKFGVNIKGSGSDFKVRLGRANFNPDKIVHSQRIADTTRVNLINEIKKVFDFGVRNGRSSGRVSLPTPATSVTRPADLSVGGSVSHADSVMLMQQGVLEMTKEVADSITASAQPQKRRKKK